MSNSEVIAAQPGPLRQQQEPKTKVPAPFDRPSHHARSLEWPRAAIVLDTRAGKRVTLRLCITRRGEQRARRQILREIDRLLFPRGRISGRWVQ